MMKLWLFAKLLFLASCQKYVPGTPGGAWTQERNCLWHGNIYAH